MKVYTNREQSKRLSEILPIESADMARFGGENIDISSRDNVIMTNYISAKKEFSMCGEIPISPCWSLSALLSVLSFPALRYDIEDGEGGWIVSCEKNDKRYLSYYRDNPVDTCYEMILKLHEQKLL